MSRPILYTFAISHVCEYAVWAAAALRSDVEVRPLVPGAHVALLMWLGARRTSVPVLWLPDGELVQGSARIVARMQARAAAPLAAGLSAGNADRVAQIEMRLQGDLMKHARRFIYSEALHHNGGVGVREFFARGMSTVAYSAFWCGWPVLRALMVSGMDCRGAETLRESQAVVERELAWLDEQLADGRRFLVADRLTRADLCAAALVATLARPAEHPEYVRLPALPQTDVVVATWHARPSFAHTRRMYAEFRRVATQRSDFVRSLRE